LRSYVVTRLPRIRLTASQPPNVVTSSLPDPLFEAIQSLLEGPEDQLTAGIDALCEAHPTHATAIREWVAECHAVETAPRTPGGSRLDTDPLGIALLHSVPTVGGFKILGPTALYRTVGAGGMGCVFRGRHLRLDHDVAVKCMRPDLAERSDSAFQRFEREARVGARLSSENIIHVTDCGAEHGLHYIVMEWVDGEDLSKRVQRLGPRDPSEVATLLVGMARGLADIHGESILHRDIKPQNIMLARNGVVKIADLGIASLASEGLTMSNELLGTRGYMAPEQWDPKAKVGPAADIYALGLTAYFLLQGRHAVHMPLEEAPRLRVERPDLDPRFADLIDRCTLHTAEARYADGAALLAALRELGLGNQDGRLHRVATELPDKSDDDAAPGLDVAALRRDLELGTDPAADAPTLVSTPRPQRPAAAPRPRGRVGRWALVALVTAAIGLSLWAAFGTEGGSPGKRPSADREQGRQDPEAQQPDRSQAGGPDAEGKGSPQAAKGTAGEGSDSGPQPIAATPAILRAAGGFAGEVSLEADATWIWASPFAFGARDDVVFEIQAKDCADLVVSYWPEGSTEKRRGKVEKGAADAEGQRFTVTIPGAHAARYGILLEALADDPAVAVSRQLALEVPCTMPAVVGLERIPPDTLIDGGVTVGTPHYLTARGTNAELPKMRFAMLPPAGATTEIVLVGMTEVSRADFKTFLDAGRDVFRSYLGEDAAYLARIDSVDARYTELETNPAKPSDPVMRLHVQEAHAFARWLGDQTGLRVQLIDAATWRRAALANANLPAETTGEGYLPFPATEQVDVNFSPSSSDQTDLANRPIVPINPEQQTLAAAWSVYSGRQGILPLFNIAGNAAEVCVVDRDATGSPIRGRILGGDYTDALDRLYIRAAGGGVEWTLENMKDSRPGSGYRLAIFIEN